jgi:RHH-type rel operon transcriptional repressor/antitoxin RelB
MTMGARGSLRVAECCPLLYMYSKEIAMLALRLPPGIEERLEAMAKKTGRTKSFYARQAILEKIEDMEDYYLAEERLKTPGKRVSMSEVLDEFAADLGSDQR